MEKRIRKDLDHICREFGTRVLGSPAEARLAEFVRARFAAAGLETGVEEFPVTVSDLDEVSLGTIKNGRRRSVPCLAGAFSGFTKGEEVLGLEYLENTSAAAMSRRRLEGKAVILYGGAGETIDDYRRLLESGARALLMISKRHPFPWPVTTGLPWQWLEAGTLPMVSIPFFEAEKMLLGRVSEVFIRVSGRSRLASSQNVIGLRKGRGRKNIVVCAHHDTVSVGKGAIDNGTGVAILLALAEELAASPAGAKNIALVSFGAEEVLSRGSFHFVENNPGFVSDTAMVFNIDGEGSALGQSRISHTGGPRLTAYLESKAAASPGYYELVEKVSPFSDQFPFNMAGVPSAWFMRHNFWEHYYQFHSRRDLPGVVDAGLVARSARLILEMSLELAAGPGMPFPRSIPARLRSEMARLEKGLNL